MNVLFVNTLEKTGGAAIAAGRLRRALEKEGVQTALAVRSGKMGFYGERASIWLANHLSREGLFSVDIANWGEDITKTRQFQEADIIHLHWVNQGFLSLKGLEKIFRSGKPVVWTMHDMWPVTGICHHARDCERYFSECHNCPQLMVPSANDLSNSVFNKKRKLYQNVDFEVVSVSRWLAKKAQQSALLHNKHISVIPNVVPIDKFQILDKDRLKQKWGILDKDVIIFGAARLDDVIKGFDLLLKSIKTLINKDSRKKDNLHLVLFGNVKGNKDEMMARIPVPYTYCGSVKNDDLSELFSIADVVASTSYYETFGLTLAEALACGCIPVSWDNSGQTDIIRHKENGYLAKYLDINSFADGLEWALDEGRMTITRQQQRQDVNERFSETVVARQYISLYKTICQKH